MATVLLGSLRRCQVADDTATVDEASRLGWPGCAPRCFRHRAARTICWSARATMPSFLRYGAYPYIVVVRERPDIEHRFVGLFTAAASNANVLEIPLIRRRVQAALAASEDDPSHPGQLLLDIFQTIPRSELFSLDSAQLLEMAEAVIDLGSRRRALLFLRADQLGHFVSCLVYLLP